MAGTITETVQVTVVNGEYQPGPIGGTDTITQTGQAVAAGIMTIATSNTALTVGSVTTFGRLYLKNLDAANFVTYGSTAGLEWKLKAGEQATGRLTPGTTVEFKADTAAVKLQFALFND